MSSVFESDDLWNQLGNAVSLVACEAQIVWTVFGLFSAAEAVLFAGLFEHGDLPKGSTAIFVSLAGAVLSTVWWVTQRRAILYQGFYEGIVAQLETRLGFTEEANRTLSVSGTINNIRHAEALKGSIPIRSLMNYFPLVLAILWILGLVVALLLVLSGGACRSAVAAS